jgi:hypothetical protein
MDRHGEETMKKMIMAALFAALLGTFGYGSDPYSGSPAGKWRGTIPESGRNTLVGTSGDFGHWWRQCDIVVLGVAAKFVSPSRPSFPQVLEFNNPSDDMMLHCAGLE